jgi:hypothetical protein
VPNVEARTSEVDTTEIAVDGVEEVAEVVGVEEDGAVELRDSDIAFKIDYEHCCSNCKGTKIPSIGAMVVEIKRRIKMAFWYALFFANNYVHIGRCHSRFRNVLNYKVPELLDVLNFPCAFHLGHRVHRRLVEGKAWLL